MSESRTAERAARGARKIKLALLGPAFIAAIGYIDPGNFATNIQAGASLRLQAAVGGRLGQHYGDVDPDAVCQAGYCHR